MIYWQRYGISARNHSENQGRRLGVNRVGAWGIAHSGNFSRGLKTSWQ